MELGDNRFSNINVVSFTQWTYLNFHDRTLQTAEIAEDGSYTDPDGWDIALHRWDTRTNGSATGAMQYVNVSRVNVAGVDVNLSARYDFGLSGRYLSEVHSQEYSSTNYDTIVDVNYEGYK